MIRVCRTVVVVVIEVIVAPRILLHPEAHRFSDYDYDNDNNDNKDNKDNDNDRDAEGIVIGEPFLICGSPPPRSRCCRGDDSRPG